MRRSSQILTAVAVAGMAVAGSAAFTGTGLTNNAGGSQFIGGTVSQTVSGATLQSVNYTNFWDATHTGFSTIQLQFASSDAVTGRQVSLVPHGDVSSGTFNCTPIDAQGGSTCTYSLFPDEPYVGLTSIDVTVSNDLAD